MQRVWLLNWNNITYDKDISAWILASLNAGIVEWFAISWSGASAEIEPWKAMIECIRTNGEKIMVAYQNTVNVPIDMTWTKKVYIEIDQAKIDDWSSNNEDGTGIWAITTNPSAYPTVNFVKLYSIASDVVTDDKINITIKDILNLIWLSQNITTSLDITANAFFGDWSNLTWLSAEVETTKSTITYWEEITASDISDWYTALYVDTSNWKAYKTNASNSAKINFIWHAIEIWLTDTTHKISTSWVKDWFTWMIIWSDQYLTHSSSIDSVVKSQLQDSNNFQQSPYDRYWQTLFLTNKIKISSIDFKLAWTGWEYTHSTRAYIYDWLNWPLIATSDNEVFPWASYNIHTFTFTGVPYVQNPFITAETPSGVGTYWINTRFKDGLLSPYSWESYYWNWSSRVRNPYGNNYYPLYFNVVWEELVIDTNSKWVIGNILYWSTIPVKTWKSISASKVEIQTNNDWHLTWLISSSATAWWLTPPNITEYVTIKVNWVDRKIWVYAV